MCTCSPLSFILVNLNELNIYSLEMYLGRVDAQWSPWFPAQRIKARGTKPRYSIRAAWPCSVFSCVSYFTVRNPSASYPAQTPCDHVFYLWSKSPARFSVEPSPDTDRESPDPPASMEDHGSAYLGLFVDETTLYNRIVLGSLLPSRVWDPLPHFLQTWLRNYLGGTLIYFLSGFLWCFYIYYWKRNVYVPKGM